MPRVFRSDHQTAHEKEVRTLLRRLEASGARLLSGATVWGAFPASDGEAWLLMLHGPDAPHRLQAQALILATGAYDRPISFPGWTLPGVMTAGAVQTLLKHQRVLPGRRVLFSGTGPLQLAAAAQLAEAGAEVVGVLEGASVLGWSAIRHLPAMWGQWQRLREGWGYWRALRRAGVPLRFGWSVVEARGDGEIQEAVIARLDKYWRPIPNTRQTIAVDALAIGYGLIPAIQLSRLLDCQHDFRPERGGYIPRRDDLMQTSLPGVYAAGDGAGIGGAELSRVEGRIAGLAAAYRLGRLDEGALRAAIAKQRPTLTRERRFARMLGDLFTPGPGLYTLAADDTFICRCEEVSLREIRDAVEGGAQSVNEVKGLTRAGMGNCQGRLCGELVARAVADEIGGPEAVLKRVEAAGAFTVRPPIFPVPLSVLAEAADEAR